jgi:hypothetical protein
MSKRVIIALCAASFALGAAYGAVFEIVPLRSACATASCHLHLAGG